MRIKIELTMDELRTLITEIVEEVLDRRAAEIQHLPTKKRDTRTLKEVLESIERHRFTPLPGTPTSAEMIREDRDNDEPYR